VNGITQTSGHPWFALNAKFRYEDFVATHLRGKGYEVFLPVYTTRRRWSDRVKEVEAPLFPGYLFCRFDVTNRLPILTTPGMIQIVGFGKTPTPVSEGEIDAIQKAIGNDLAREPWPFSQIGQRARVEHGPLRGIEGVLHNVKGRHRLVLSVTLLQRSIAVEIDSAWVTPISQSQQAPAKARVSPAA
jgi:transcription antitermination factor NusG